MCMVCQLTSEILYRNRTKQKWDEKYLSVWTASVQLFKSIIFRSYPIGKDNGKRERERERIE
jgi:hypothetical protein